MASSTPRKCFSRFNGGPVDSFHPSISSTKLYIRFNHFDDRLDSGGSVPLGYYNNNNNKKKSFEKCETAKSDMLDYE